MIDFERCYKTNKPKNVTQFCQFILNYLKNILKEKGFKIDKKVLNALIRYKHNQDEKNFNEILKIIR
jgi:predicted Ser/Thr protein kinase